MARSAIGRTGADESRSPTNIPANRSSASSLLDSLSTVVPTTTVGLLREELGGTPSAQDEPHRPDVGGFAFRKLLWAFLTLELEPGGIVSERQLMELADATRSALRQAVARLADLGLITPLARKGLMIAPLDVLEVSVVYDARWAIETRLARFAALRATDNQIEGLKRLADTSNRPAPETAQQFMQRDQELHLAIAASARNIYLEDALTRIMPRHVRLWHRLYRELGNDQDFMFQHDDIIAAIERRDPEAAETAVTEHLEAARGILATVFIPLSDRRAR